MHKRSKRSRSRFTLERMERRVLFAVLDVGDFGAIIDDGHDDHQAIQRALDAAGPGDAVSFQPGTYDLSRSLLAPGSITLDGNKATLRANVGDRGWAIEIEGGASNLTIDGFFFNGGGIVAQGARDYTNIRITNNDFTNPAHETFNGNGPAILFAQDSDATVIDNNSIHDYDGYGVMIYSANNLQLTWNTFSNLDQGGHLLELGNDCDVSFNRLVGMERMGFEIQTFGDRKASNLTVEGNVLTDWRQPWRDSFGLSVVPDGSHNTRVINNYIRGVPAGWDGQWNPREHQTSDGPRMGYGIEYGSNSGEISGNMIGGAFANHVVVSGGGGSHNGPVHVRDNHFFGDPLWRETVGTIGSGAPGFALVEANNRLDGNYHNMPAAPAAGVRDNPDGAATPRVAAAPDFGNDEAISEDSPADSQTSAFASNTSDNEDDQHDEAITVEEADGDLEEMITGDESDSECDRNIAEQDEEQNLEEVLTGDESDSECDAIAPEQDEEQNLEEVLTGDESGSECDAITADEEDENELDETLTDETDAEEDEAITSGEEVENSQAVLNEDEEEESSDFDSGERRFSHWADLDGAELESHRGRHWDRHGWGDGGRHDHRGWGECE